MTAPLARRALLGAGFGGAALAALAPAARAGFANVPVAGISPPLRFSMVRASDGRQVTEADYRGRVVLLYLGYTFCPDACPLTLNNLALVLKRLGPLAAQVRVLFVTVDPERDTLPVLRQYAALFGPEVDGLRGTPDELAALARRYRLAYSVTKEGGRVTVTHSAAIVAFDRAGAARLLIPALSITPPDIDGTASDLRTLITEDARPGFLARLVALLSGLV